MSGDIIGIATGALPLLRGAMLGALLLGGAHASAQDALFDRSPEAQDPDEIARVFGVEVDALPPGSVWRRLRSADGRRDGLQLEIPATLSAAWSAPAPYAVSCPVMLTISRTGDAPGSTGLVSNIQMVMVDGGGLGGGVFSRIVDGEAMTSPLSDSLDLDPTVSRPNGSLATAVVMPGPGCRSLMDAMMQQAPGSGVDEVLSRPDVQRELAEMEPEERRAMEAAVRENAGRLSAIRATGMSDEELQTAACFAQAIPVVRVLDASPERFHLLMAGTVEGPDEELCPVVSARAQLHVGAPIDDTLLSVVSHSPEPVILRGPDQNTVECTNNDPTAPLVEVVFSQPVARRSLEDNIRLLELGSSGWEDTGYQFSTDGQGRVYLEPDQYLEPLSRYRVEVTGGQDGVRGLGENTVLDGGYVFDFQTAPVSDSPSFEAAYSDAVEFHAYQGSRDAPVLPDRPVVLRSEFNWNAASENRPAEALPANMCVRVEAREVNASRGAPALFDPTDFPFPREDSVTEESRRMGRDRALVTGWTPGQGEARQAQLEMTYSLVNFTSANSGAEAPELTYQPARQIEVLPHPVSIPVRMFTLAFDDQADLDDVVLPDQGDEVNLTNQDQRNHERLNAGARQLSGYIAADWALVQDAGRRFMPLNSMPFSQAGVYPMRGVGQALTVKNEEGEDETFNLSGGAENGASDLALLTRQFEESYRRVILPSCVGSEMCLGVLPIPYGGARAFYDAQNRHRGMLIGLDSLPYRRRLPTVIVHETGHAHGLAHVPNDYDRHSEQELIKREVANLRRRGPLRWTGIDQVMLWPDGRVGYRHSEDGNSEHRDLWPLMYNTALDPLEGGIQMDQYEQLVVSMQNGRSTNPDYYGPHPALSNSSSQSMHAVLADMHRLRWRETVADREPELETLVHIAEGDQSGVAIGLGLVRDAIGWRIPYHPVLSATLAAVEQGAGDTGDLLVRVLDAQGREIVSRRMGALSSRGVDPVWLDGFLPLSSEQALAVRTLELVDAGRNRTMGEIAVPQIDPSGRVQVRQSGDQIMVSWTSGSAGLEARVFWRGPDGAEQLVWSGPDAGQAHIDRAWITIAQDGGPGQLVIERTNGVALHRMQAPLALSVLEEAPTDPFPVVSASWSLEPASVSVTSSSGDVSGPGGFEFPAGVEVNGPLPLLHRAGSSEEDAAQEQVEDGFERQDDVLVRTPTDASCTITPADLDEFINFQLASLPEEMRGEVAAETRVEMQAALADPNYNRQGLCDALEAIRSAESQP